MTQQDVFCKKLAKKAPGLAKAPFPGKLGQEILENVSEEAWLLWKDYQIKVINEYRLNLANPEQYQELMRQLRLFLGLETGSALAVESPERAAANARK